ncbi:MAG: DUF1508 domain-containing protein, partial [Bacteroidota bacterium]
MKLRLYRENDSLYFQVQSDDGKTLLTSNAYQSETQRDADGEFALANATDEDYYQVAQTDAGLVLKVQNAAQQNIANSNAYASRAALNADFGFINAAQTVAGTPYQGRAGDDDYEPLTFYQAHGSDLQNGFDTFEHEKGCFFTYNVSGIILLISEAYTSKRSRDNGVDSVTRNMTIAERYQRQVHPTGNHYFNLLAGNRQEIATSIWFRSAEEMENAIRILLAGGQGGTVTTEIVAANRSASIAIAAAPTPAGDEAPKKRKKRKKRTTAKPKAEKVYLKEGNYLFNDLSYQIFRSGNGKHYFTFKNADGKTLLLNADVRGYETEAEAQAVVDKILKFGPFERNFEGKTTKNGKYYFYLRDEEGKNLGKSFFYNTTEEMQSYVGLFLGSEIASATFEAEAPAAARSVAAATTAAVAAASAASAGKNIDEYLSCGSYQGHQRAADHPEFSLFEYEGEYYFTMHQENGDVHLRSEGYTSTKGRDNGVQSVIKNRENEKRWGTREADGKHFAILKAGNHQEIGCSCPLDSAAAALALAGWMVPAAKSAGVIEDYLPCKEYKGHKRSAVHADFTEFTYDGEYYFAMVDENGEVALRSEGYKKEKSRTNGINSVVKNREIEKRWSTLEEDGKYYGVLKASNGQEIGRTCPKSDKAAALGWWKGFLALGALGAAATTRAATPVLPPTPPPPAPTPPPAPKPIPPVIQSEPKEETAAGAAVTGAGLAAAAAAAAGAAKAASATPPPKKVVTTSSGTAKPVAGAAATGGVAKGAAAGGGFNWRWLLLLLPLLLALLWWKGCFVVTDKPDVTPPATTETV